MNFLDQTVGGVYIRAQNAASYNARRILRARFIRPKRRVIDPSHVRVLCLLRLGRGAEARSSRADVPRNFGGLCERCSRRFRRSRRRQSRRGGWGARLRPAHCHPRNRMERYRGAWRLEFSALYLLCCALSLSLIKSGCGLVAQASACVVLVWVEFAQKHTG
jgi:hypothetical protein